MTTSAKVLEKTLKIEKILSDNNIKFERELENESGIDLEIDGGCLGSCEISIYINLENQPVIVETFGSGTTKSKVDGLIAEA